MSLGHEFIGKNSKAIKGLSVRILDLWDFIFREGQCFFASLPSRRPSSQFVYNPETKKGGYLYDRQKSQENFVAIKIVSEISTSSVTGED